MPGEEMLEVVRRAFVYRDNSEILGTERAGQNQFAMLIEDIPSKEGALELLRNLTEIYPDEAHFWAHLGRFHSLERRDFPAAVDCIDRALKLRDRDHVLHHMKGMALRQQVYDGMGADKVIPDIVGLAKLASESFSAAREIAPDDEHGYISEVQMMIRLLDYAARKTGGNVLKYLGVRAQIRSCARLLNVAKICSSGSAATEKAKGRAPSKRVAEHSLIGSTVDMI